MPGGKFKGGVAKVEDAKVRIAKRFREYKNAPAGLSKSANSFAGSTAAAHTEK